MVASKGNVILFSFLLPSLIHSKKKIEADGTVPAKVLKQKSRTKGALYTVFFYGSRD